MNIAQLSVTYQAVEDRLLLRVGTTDKAELRVWLTRRFALAILPVLERCTQEHATRNLQASGSASYAAHDPYVRRSLAEFESATHLEKADFQTPFEPQPTALLLDGQTLLPAEGHFTARQDGITDLVLRAGKIEVKLELAAALLHALLKLVRDGLDTAQWNHEAPAAPQVSMAETSRVLN